MKRKKAFTLVEIVISLMVAGFIGFLVFRHYMISQFYSSVNKMDNNIINILENAVMNPVEGYVNGTGGDCSSNNTYEGLSAARAIDCIGWSRTYPYKGVKSTDGTKSYIYTLLRNYSKDGEGCKLYLGANPNDDTSFYVFLDCSNLDSAYAGYKGYIERKVNADLRNALSTIVQNTYFNATSLYNTTGGNSKDGKIGFLLKK